MIPGDPGMICRVSPGLDMDFETAGRFWMAGVTPLVHGEYLHELDAKGRLALPAELVPDLGAEVIVTRGREAGLYVLPLPVWHWWKDKRGLAHPWRVWFGQPARQVRICRSTNRISLGQDLRESVGLQIRASVVLLSQSWGIEVLPAERWRKHLREIIGELESPVETWGRSPGNG